MRAQHALLVMLALGACVENAMSQECQAATECSGRCFGNANASEPDFDCAATNQTYATNHTPAGCFDPSCVMDVSTAVFGTENLNSSVCCTNIENMCAGNTNAVMDEAISRQCASVNMMLRGTASEITVPDCNGSAAACNTILRSACCRPISGMCAGNTDSSTDMTDAICAQINASKAMLLPNAISVVISLGGTESECVDTPDWHNGNTDGGASGETCAGYADERGGSPWCWDGQGHEWAMGETHNFPELNCCVCGAGGSSGGTAAYTPGLPGTIFDGAASVEDCCTAATGRCAANADPMEDLEVEALCSQAGMTVSPDASSTTGNTTGDCCTGIYGRCFGNADASTDFDCADQTYATNHTPAGCFDPSCVMDVSTAVFGTENLNSSVCCTDCPAGFTGDNCETDVDECASAPCQNGANCVESGDANTCGSYFRRYASWAGGADPTLSQQLLDAGFNDSFFRIEGWNSMDAVVPADAYICSCQRGFLGGLCEWDFNLTTSAFEIWPTNCSRSILSVMTGGDENLECTTDVRGELPDYDYSAAATSAASSDYAAASSDYTAASSDYVAASADYVAASADYAAQVGPTAQVGTAQVGTAQVGTAQVGTAPEPQQPFVAEGPSPCDSGSFGPSGDDQSSCAVCGRGAWSPANATACTACDAGRFNASVGSTSSNNCAACGVGTYSAAGDTTCMECRVGQYSGAASPTCGSVCPAGTIVPTDPSDAACVACQPGKFTDAAGAIECADCPAGKFMSDTSATACIDCLVGQYEPATGSDECSNLCSAANGTLCATTGMPYPRPAFGYYMADETQIPAKCQPMLACSGSAQYQADVDFSAGVLVDIGAYRGEYGAANCAAGYAGYRCAACLVKVGTPELGTPSDGDPDGNGFYRLDGTCQACGTPIPKEILGIAFIIVFLVVALLADRVLGKVKNISQLLAPILILMTFFQTLALMLQMELRWPPELRAWMEKLSILNLNLELARPECSISWDAELKLQFILVSPALAMGLILLYIVAKCISSKGKDFSVESVIKMIVTMFVGVVMVATTFFLKGVLAGFDCTTDFMTGLQFLDAQPDIECSDADPRYANIKTLSVYGLAGWGFVMVVICVMFLGKSGRERFNFLTGKMEDKW